MSLRDACDYITQERVFAFLKRSYNALRQLIDKDAPLLAVAGLNPHSGEHGLFGDEEVRYISLAIERARAEGMNVVGPIGADSVFHQALDCMYDAVISLYHDQGHIATKMVDFERTISLTLGMKYLRTSVDHGTALDIAGRNIANPIGTILSGAMMLKYSFGLVRESAAIEAAVDKVLDAGYRTEDIMSEGCRRVSCTEMGGLIADSIR
jgi:4-hydroxythreonine-4-phosphate dehydrogenase